MSNTLKIATSAYPIEWMDSWDAYAKKQRDWVFEASQNGADLLVFPEYGAMELAALEDHEQAAHRTGSLAAVSARWDELNTLFSSLSSDFGCHILGPSAPAWDGQKYVNRAGLYSPTGGITHQDKQIMTRFEREEWGVASGGPLKVYETALGKIGIIICYDSEFPLLSRALTESGVELLLVPSCTEALSGYWRVRIGAMARALESQCVSVMASLVGGDHRLYGVEKNTGTGGIFGPPDNGFPPTGVLAEGTLNEAGWTYAIVDKTKIAAARAGGQVLGVQHWPEQSTRACNVTVERLA